MATLPFHVIPVSIDGQIRFCVYRGSQLEIDVPLRQRQALVLAAQILNCTLTVESGARGDPLVLKALLQRGVAQVPTHARNMGIDRN